MGQGPVPRDRPALPPVIPCAPGGSPRTVARLITALLSAGLATPPLLAGPVSAPAASVPEPYLDRVMDAGPQADSADEEAQEAYDASGWARGLRLEYSLAATRGPSESLVKALSFTGFLDTPAHGAFSLSAAHVDSDLNPVFFGGTRQAIRAGTWRLDQRALPLDGGWVAHHGLGDVQTLLPSLSRGLSRVFIPTTPLSGATGEYLLHDAAALNVAVGRPGVFSGVDVFGFQPGRGRLASAGGQFRLSGSSAGPSRLDAAFQVARASDVADAGIAGSKVDSTWGAIAWQGVAPWASKLDGGSAGDPAAARPGGARLQASVMASRGPAGAGRASGLWIDAAWRSRWMQNTAGWFDFKPGLRWATASMPGDLRGGYWRADLFTRQWQLGWSLEGSDTTTGAWGRSAFGNIHGRYLVTVRDALGATVAVRTGNGWARSLQVDWDRASEWGNTHSRGRVLHAADGHTYFLGLDQTWPTATPALLTTSLGWQRHEGALGRTSLWSWAVLGSVSPLARFTLDASLQGTHGERRTALFANVGAAWQLTRDWTLAARYTHARGEEPLAAEVVSALTAATVAARMPVPDNRSLQVVLRYEVRAGAATVPLGGTRGAGAGRLSGTVYYDHDNNGRREATEAGVPNVIVVLDGRFAVRTDGQGRYDFPWVVAGEHVVQVQPDNVPLPWSPKQREPSKTQVEVRGHTVEDFALWREP